MKFDVEDVKLCKPLNIKSKIDEMYEREKNKQDMIVLNFIKSLWYSSYEHMRSDWFTYNWVSNYEKKRIDNGKTIFTASMHLEKERIIANND